MENLSSSVKKVVKHWWVSVFIGILAIVLGVWCIAAPWDTIIALSIVFAISFLISGISEIVFAIANRNSVSGWGWTLASGIIDIIFGIIIISLPLPVITLFLAVFVGFWVLFQSIWGIGSACELQRRQVSGWGWLLALAILGVMLSFVFIISPIFTSGMIVTFASLSFITYGIFRIYYGFRLKSIKSDFKKIDKELEDR